MAADTSYTRIIVKQSDTPGETATVPASDDHTDGTWLTTDIYIGEALLNTADNILYYRTDPGIMSVDLSSSDNKVYMVEVDIASPDMLAIHTTPITIVAADGAGRGIEVISASISENIGTDAYSAGKLKLKCSSATIPQFTDEEILKSTAKRCVKMLQVDSAYAATDTQIVGGDAVVLTADANPTSGNGSFKVFVHYRYLAI
jgi:hypothetical protein